MHGQRPARRQTLVFLSCLAVVAVFLACPAGVRGAPLNNSFVQCQLPEGPATPVFYRPALQSPVHDPWPQVVHVTFSDRDQVAELAGWAVIWEVDHEQGTLIAEVDARGYQRMQAAGLAVTIDEDLTMLLHQPLVRLAGQTAGIPGYPCYRTVEETFAAAQQMAADYPHLAAWIDIGDSWERVRYGAGSGYDMRVLRLTRANGQEEKARIIVTSAIHARELSTAELVMRFAERLVSGYGNDPDITWLLDQNEVHLLLQANPDGRKQAEGGKSWRKNTNEDYCSPTSDYRGADLNRNFSFEWACCGGASNSPCSILYRGPSAASEPEIVAIEDYMRAVFPDQRDDDLDGAAPVTATGIYLDIHSYGELMLWPWGFTYTPTANATALQTLGRKLAYFNGYTPQQAVNLYPTDGASDDFGYGELGLATYTIELGTAFFQDCATFENTILPTNLDALLYAVKAARLPYLTPAGPDALDLTISPVVVWRGDLITVAARLDDTRYQNSHGLEPTQPISTALITLGQPSWAITGSLTQTLPSLSAADGAFDESIEDVTGVLAADTEAGRQLVFVQGVDGDGNVGAASAAFVNVLEAGVSPVVEGFVRDGSTHAPLAARVTSGPFVAFADPATGYYTLPLISGTHPISASAVNHAAGWAAPVVARNGGRYQRDILLAPCCTALTDDVEAGEAEWQAEGDWSIVSSTYHSPGHAWTDSPGGPYEDNVDAGLTSRELDLSLFSQIELAFWHAYDLEDGYDFGHVEFASEAITWTSVLAVTGADDNLAWRPMTASLAALDGASLGRIRFRLQTDHSVVKDGWYVDDIRLTGVSTLCHPASVRPRAALQAPTRVPPGQWLRVVNLTTGTMPLSYVWSFGDGISSTRAHPTHTYVLPGTFTISLEAENEFGSDRAMQRITVDSPVYLPLVLRQRQGWWMETGQSITSGPWTDRQPSNRMEGDTNGRDEQGGARPRRHRR